MNHPLWGVHGSSEPLLRAAWVAGPDAGAAVLLPVGRHLVGRAPGCAVRCDDPALAAHHAVVEVARDGTWRWTTLVGGPTPAEGDDPRCRTAGRSLLLLTPVPGGRPLAERRAGVVHRPPRVLRADPPVTPAGGDTRPDAADTDGIAWSGLLPSALGVVAAIVIAVITGQAMFAILGVVGSAVGVAAWAVGALGDRRRVRRAIADRRRALAANEQHRVAGRTRFVEHHRATVTDLTTAIEVLTADDDRLWQRRPNHPDAWLVALGHGEITWPAGLADDDIHGPSGFPGTVTTTIGPGSRTALRGRAAVAHDTAAAIVVQLLAGAGPADLRLMVVTRRPDAWRWLHDAPHVRCPDGSVAVVDEGRAMATAADLFTVPTGSSAPHLVIVTDDPDCLVARTAPVRRLLEHDRMPALVVLMTDDQRTPHVCRAELSVDERANGRWVPDTTDHHLPATVHVARLVAPRAAAAIAAIAGSVDPEAPGTAAALPAAVDLGALLGDPDAATIAIGWQRSATDAPPAALLGLCCHPDAGVEPVLLDLAHDGPHALVAGTTGSGKSELLRSWVLALAVARPPSDLQFVLVDFKGGAAFDALAGLPHVAGVVTDLDGAAVERCILGLDAELRRREQVLRDHGAVDLTDLRRRDGVTMARLVVVVDEFAVLARERPDDLAALVDLARRGRSLGMHLVLATQRPAGVVTDDIRANTAVRIALRVHDTADAVDVVDDAGPARFARTVPGRAMLRLGDDTVVLQTAFCPDPTVLVARVGEAAATVGHTAAAPVWLPPLPDTIAWRPGPVVGRCDDPVHRRADDLTQPDDGHLLVVGGSRDTTLALDTLVRAARWRGDDVFVLGGLRVGPWVGATVVSADDGERRLRLLRRLVAGVDTPTVLVVAGAASLRAAIGDDHHDEIELLSTLLRADPADGRRPRVVVAAEHHRDIPLPWLACCPHRWVFRLADVGDGAALGVGVRDMPTGPTGRCAVVHPSRPTLAAQLARWDGDLHLVDGSTAPTPPIEVLPDHLHADDLHLPGDALCVGLDFDHLQPATVTLDDETPVTVLGPPRSGRSTVLAQLTAEWSRLHPAGHVAVLAPRRTSLEHPEPARTVDALLEQLADVAALDDVLLVVDDAELVDDPRLGDLVQRPATAVLVAATPDGLRHSYGHWTAPLRRSRVAVLAAGCDRLDGDLVGATLPRRAPIAPRPGLVWVAEHGSLRLAQVATPAAAHRDRLRLTLAAVAHGGRGR